MVADKTGDFRDRTRGGRPTKYTPARVVALMSELFAGATRAEAARKAGVSPATLYAWLKLGREGRPAFAPLAEAFAGVEQRRGAWRSIIGTKKRRGFWSPVR